tara:strand:- start:2951 stop:3175 length:225 start_codon:yes stop_codon:yes gene_type:complete
MKTKRKPSNNKELERRTDILMMEIQKHNHAIDTLFMTLSHYIEMNGDSDKIRDFITKKNKEAEDVRPELQKSSS